MIDTANSLGTWIGPALTSLGSFATAGLGFLALRVLDARKDERTYRRKKAARREARRDKIIEKRNEFQRQTLLELQDAVQQSIRDTAELQLHDIRAAREGFEWRKNSFPHELSERTRLTNVQTMRLGVRVRDEQIRLLLSTFRKCCTNVQFATNEQASERQMSESSDKFAELNDRIGQVIRQLDEVELAD